MGRTMDRVASAELPPFATGPLSLFPNKPLAGLEGAVRFIILLISQLSLTLLSWLLSDLRDAENTAVCCHLSFCFTCSGPGLVAVLCGHWGQC